ncbi:hypothetical protein QJS10_CPA05g00184 [Acorus calamus]|uniref:Uncharacterized protein n=1 Tax=Acorus calamus TaxID=4465 RepID=A0AAV9EVF6_ACOCL|nr:hypothetical protein QJS10_CPA05g00184 [Acorus calamus]
MNFHAMDIAMYERLTRRMGKHPESAKHVIALWLWMKYIQFDDLVEHLTRRDDPTVDAFFAEAQRCLEVIFNDDVTPPPTDDDSSSTPNMASRLADNEPFGLRFFDFHRDISREGVTLQLSNVCAVIFDEGNLTARRALGGGEGGTSAAVSSGTSAAAGKRRLNPMAQPWVPELEMSNEGRRSIFLTFSKGTMNPLTRQEIAQFFNQRYGHCVERVMLEKTKPGYPPVYGRIILTQASFIPIILNGVFLKKFFVNGRELWARIYVPKNEEKK